jgi:hypothetical protein
METRKKPQLVDFRLQLIREILQTYHTPKTTIGRLTQDPCQIFSFFSFQNKSVVPLNQV